MSKITNPRLRGFTRNDLTNTNGIRVGRLYVFKTNDLVKDQCD